VRGIRYTRITPAKVALLAAVRQFHTMDDRIVRLKETKVRVTVKLSALWDAKTHVFHSAKVIHGASRATSTFKHLVKGCRVKIEALFADSEFSSRPNVQLCANNGLFQEDIQRGARLWYAYSQIR